MAEQDATGGAPETAMVLAAGLGTRMRPITERLPKALVRVCGKALIDHALDALAAVGTGTAVVNVHHLADQVEAHLAARPAPRIIISDERARLLESGGGIARALPALGARPFYVLNADSFWIEGSRANLGRLVRQWDGGVMDGLLLVAGVTNAIGYAGDGDFTMDAVGRLVRRGERRVAPFAYAGAAILHPRLFASAPDGPFSLNLLFDQALERGRLFGLRLDGLWLHVGTPEAIREAEEAIARSAA
ncbi:MAG: mannose-1-phosphate guanylyltransferase [Alphaproteobacteria bacterium]|nr:MAG: mannose-1-phosphate guanylyltransferase [Alphaproteobacteria bacterium]